MKGKHIVKSPVYEIERRASVELEIPRPSVYLVTTLCRCVPCRTVSFSKYLDAIC